jgi:transcriptional regulator with XRE-family HTH domain
MREIALTSMDHELADPIHSPKTGKDLRTWRKALGLRQGELAKVLSLNHHTISRAERAKEAQLKREVFVAVQLLQHRLVHGEIDLSPIFKKRPPLGRPRKKSIGSR